MRQVPCGLATASFLCEQNINSCSRPRNVFATQGICQIFWIFCAALWSEAPVPAPLCISFCLAASTNCFPWKSKGEAKQWIFSFCFTASRILPLSATFALGKGFSLRSAELLTQGHVFMCVQKHLNWTFPLQDPVIGWWGWLRTLLEGLKWTFLYWKGE